VNRIQSRMLVTVEETAKWEAEVAQYRQESLEKESEHCLSNIGGRNGVLHSGQDCETGR
jgi:hypothetical protein